MTTHSYAVRDSMTMVRRSLKHMLRYPVLTLMVAGIPVVVLLLFAYVFGDTMGAGLVGVSGGRAEYVNYLAPGILLLAVAGSAQGTAISVAVEIKEGIIARFRTMAIAHVSVLTGHVVGAVIQTMLGLGLVVGIALLVGFRPTASLVEWMAVVGLLVLIALALTWLSVALGLAAKSIESASNTPMFLVLLPFLGSGFVPTDGMAVGLRWFADYQPFTPFIETLRGLLLGTPIGTSAVLAIVWFIAITMAGYLWAKKLYNRQPSPS